MMCSTFFFSGKDSNPIHVVRYDIFGVKEESRSGFL
jgi:hypothetical protein